MFPTDNNVPAGCAGHDLPDPDLGDWDAAPVGLAVVDRTGRVTRLNRAGAELLGVTTTGALDIVGPFDIDEPASPPRAGLPAERVTSWDISIGVHRELAYRVRDHGSDRIIAFRDVTMRRQQERRAAAVARTAARVASERSLTITLSAMASEVLQTDGLAGVQILAVDESTDKLHVMGSAGFPQSDNFFSLLMECREQGASLKMLDAFTTGQHVVVHNRYDVVMQDPAWAPLHDVLRHPRWDSFASVPLLVRGRSVGVLNVFFTPGQLVGLANMDFLTTMAEQAAMAIDYASLLERERHTVRRAERQRLARDLHDSVVQQVFSIGMQTQALKVLAERGTEMRAKSVAAVAAELEELTQSALKDLRSLVSQLHPPVVTDKGLVSALRALADNTRRRTDINVELHFSPSVAELDGDLAEDVYFVVAEAVHNAVKHSGAELIGIELAYDPATSSALQVAVRDDGCGHTAATATRQGQQSGGYGLVSMRQRTDAWGGTLTVDAGPAGTGTVVRASIPIITDTTDREGR
jgi:signal transduction histidine kinase